ncbi:MAG: HD domain-containing protein [Candidatus Thorarchaeota archaeon]|nr:MAG: HD domain-containing protein [Candidatus Thorarchaeota archaeon]
MEFSMEINDPIHGFIGLTDIEAKIINSLPYQRLRRIKQLSGGHFVYPTAEHTRFGHCIGVMYLAGLSGKRLLNRMGLGDKKLQEIRIAGLLHDIGHGPFSHVFEEVLIEKRGMNHEDVTEWIILKSELGEMLESEGISKKRIGDLVRGRQKTKKDSIIAGIVAGQIDSDKMDYLIRDSFYCGVNYGLVDIHRLIDSIEISKDYQMQFDIAARGALESFLVARYEMFLNVYYHKTVRSVEVMLIKLINAADNTLQLTSFSTPEEFIELDDMSLISRIRSIDPSESEDAKEAARMVNLLDSRVLYKSAFEKVLHTQDRFVSKILTKSKVRESIQEEIASIAGVEKDEVIVDVPTLPSVPYNPHQLDPMEINIFEIIDGKRIPHNLSEYSNIAEMMKVYLDVIRVYTFEKNRVKVGKAARAVFQEVPDAALIHM